MQALGVKKLKERTIILSLIIFLLGITNTAYSEDEITFEEIVVTAQKREQDPQDIGYSISVLNGDKLRKLGITKSEEIASQVPNLGIRNVLGNSFPIISIRGVSLIDTKANNVSSAAVHIDEVYYSSPILIGLQLFDLERVEVLKGPQGTLFGKNTTAGAINFISRKPDDAASFANITQGNFAQNRIETGVNIPVNDNFKMRVAGVYEYSDGYIKNRQTGRDLGGDNRLSLRILADWDINDSTNILFNLHGGTDKSEVNGFQHRALLNPADKDKQCASATSRNPTATNGCVDLLGYADTDNDPFAGDFNIEGKYDNTQFGGSLTLNQDIDDITFTSITAFDMFTRVHQEDNDASPNRFVDQNYDENFDNFSQELRLSSIGNNKILNWIVGFYYATEDIDLFRDADLTDFRNNFILRLNAQEERTAFAGYAHTEWLLSERLQLTTGLRYTDETKDYDYLNNQKVNFSGSADFDNISGRIGLDYFVTDDILLYTSISKGFKSGGWPSGLTDTQVTLRPYNEEQVIAYEMGFKSGFLANRLRLNAALFYYDYTDLQLFTFIPQDSAPPLPAFGNASDAISKGLEIEMQWLPTNRIEIQLGLGLLDTKFSGFNTIGGTADDVSGQSLPNAPKTNINGLARYEIPLNNGSQFYLQSSTTYESDFSFSVQKTPATSQNSYWLANAKVGYQSKDKQWDISLWGKNITDETYLVSAIDVGLGYVLQAYGKPVSYGITLNYNWQ